MQADSWEGLTSTLQAALLAVGLLDHLKSAVPSPSGPRAAVAQGKDGFNRLSPGKAYWEVKDAYLKPAQLWLLLRWLKQGRLLLSFLHKHLMLLFNDWGLANLLKACPIKIRVKICVYYEVTFISTFSLKSRITIMQLDVLPVILNGDSHYCN